MDTEAIIIESDQLIFSISITTQLSGIGIETDSIIHTVLLDRLAVSVTKDISSDLCEYIITPFTTVVNVTINKDKISEHETKFFHMKIDDAISCFFSFTSIDLIYSICSRRLDPTRRQLSRRADGFGDFKEKDGKIYEEEEFVVGIHHRDSHFLTIHKVIISELKDVEFMGKNDPFVNLSFGSWCV